MIKIDLDEYPHEVKRVDIKGTRFYTKDGNTPLPSVTSLLDTPEKQKGLELWRKNTPDWSFISQNALARGTAVHEAIEHYLLSGQSEINITDKYRHLMPPLIGKMQKHIKAVHAIELMMHSKDVGAAGTVDLVCTLRDGRTVIADYKTSDTKKSTKYMKDYFIQTLTYARMYEEEIGRNIDGCMILNVYEKPKASCNVVVANISDNALHAALFFIEKQSKLLIEKTLA